MLKPNPPIVCLLIVTVRSCRGLSEKKQGNLIQSDVEAAGSVGQMGRVTNVKACNLNPNAVKTTLIRWFAIHNTVSQLNLMVGAAPSNWLKYFKRFDAGSQALI